MLITILLCLATLGADPAIKLRYPEKHSLLVVFDTKGNIVPVRNAQDWSRRRSHILDSMQEVMGPLPTKKVPLDVKVLEETAKEKYTLKKITYASEEGDRVPAYLLV
ncbi:MAG: acetylxylan esterase, partial [Gemmataceae bacterium]|nr:acetylxylan esterase [Gemmataceae bacterium]